ncbi:MAG: hypothetical protein ACI9WC_001406 [Arenicella sp.]|jgi:hypothetical protein
MNLVSARIYPVNLDTTSSNRGVEIAIDYGGQKVHGHQLSAVVY